MKKARVMIFFVLVFLVAAFPLVSIYAGCNSSRCSSSPDYYYARFTIDDQEYILNDGYFDIDDDDPVVVIDQNEETIQIFASTCGDYEDLDISFEFFVSLDVNTPGDYLGTFDQVGSDAGFCSASFLIHLSEDEHYGYRLSEGSITIDQTGTVGGFFEGTFNITFVPINDPAPSLGSEFTAIGDFRVLRVSDEYFQIN